MNHHSISPRVETCLSFQPLLGKSAKTSHRKNPRAPRHRLTWFLAHLYTTMQSNLMSKTKTDSLWADRDLYSGLIRLHVLHHAVEEPIFGLGMIEELGRHGYRISPGSLYPLLHGLEKKGYLRSRQQRNGKSLRKVYRATALGRKALEASRIKVRELFRELMKGE